MVWDWNVIGSISGIFGSIFLLLILSHHKKERTMYIHERFREIYMDMKYHKPNSIKDEISKYLAADLTAFRDTKIDDLYEFLNDFKHLWDGCENGMYTMDEVYNFFRKEILIIGERELVFMYRKAAAKGFENEFDEVLLLVDEIKEMTEVKKNQNKKCISKCRKRSKTFRKIRRFIQMYVG